MIKQSLPLEVRIKNAIKLGIKPVEEGNPNSLLYMRELGDKKIIYRNIDGTLHLYDIMKTPKRGEQWQIIKNVWDVNKGF